MSKKFTLIILLFGSSFAIAQDSTKVNSLDEVVFTANKYPKKQTETGKVLTVIDREQLERSGGKTLGEVLNNISGTTIVGSTSNLGTNQTVGIRGGTAGNVLILINGIPVNDPSVNDNYFDLNFFSIEQIERVEVLKGGQSTLYGSDAVAGVINIITRKAGAPGVHTDLSAAAGSYGTFKANAGLRQSSAKSLLSLQYGYTTSNGFSSAHDSTGNKNFEKDGFQQHNVTGSWQASITEKLKANVFGQYSWYKTGIDASAFVDDKDYNVTTDNLSGGGGLSYALNNGQIQFNYRYNHVNRLYLDDSSDRAPNYLRADYSGRTHYVELYGNKKWKYIELLAGVDYRQNNMSIDVLSVSQFGPYSSSLPDSIAKMWQASPYASVIVKPNRIFNIELGGRLNNHSEYGNNFSYTVNPSLFINNELKLFVNLYSAFKAPTLFELHDPLFGNRNLDPEESINIETGAQWFITNSFSVRAVYFYRDTKNSIQFIYTDPANYISQYRNIASKKAHGIEVEAAYKGDKWNFAGNYTHIEGTLRSAYDNAGFPLDKEIVVDNLFRTPKDVFNLNAGIWLTKKLYTGTSVRIAGKRLEPVYASEPKELDSYYTLDLYGEYRIRKGIKAFADFKNITDQQYFEIAGYNTRGFNLMGGLQVSL